MNRPDTSLAGSDALVSQANHADEAYQQDIADCRAEVNKRAGLDYIAHLTSGIWDFSVHSPGAALRREEFDQAARKLNLVVARIDATAESLDSGPLIRVVVQGDNGTLFHILKVAGQSFFGAALSGARDLVDRVDLQLAQLADRAAHRVGSSSLLWGGYRKRGESGDIWIPGDNVPTSGFPVYPDAAAGRLAVTAEVVRLCSAALGRNTVHFIGIYQQDTPVWQADLFDDPALAPLFQRATPAIRRHGYDKVMQQVMMQWGRILQLLSLVHSDQLTRLVLDVARGAIYILPLGGQGYYLVGVTLVQTQVEDADRKMTVLHRDLTAKAFRFGGALALPALRAGRLTAACARQSDRGLVHPVTQPVESVVQRLGPHGQSGPRKLLVDARRAGDLGQPVELEHRGGAIQRVVGLADPAQPLAFPRRRRLAPLTRRPQGA
jgi:hypothetical protein